MIKIKQLKISNRYLNNLTLVAILTVSLIFIDQSCLSVAMVQILKIFHENKLVNSLILSSYSLGMFSFFIISGHLIEAYGWKRLIIIGILLFALSSLLCACAESSISFIVSRFMQGLGASVLLTSSLVMLNLEFDSKIRGQVLGTVMGMGAVSFTLGPIFASLCLSLMNWKLIFLINIPICLISYILVYPYQVTTNIKKFKIDKIGILIIILLLVNLVIFRLDNMQRYLLLTLFLLFSIFFLYETKAQNPIFKYKQFKSRVFNIGNLLIFIVQLNVSFVMFWGLYLQFKYPVSWYKISILMLPCFFPAILMSKFVGILFDKGRKFELLFFAATAALVGTIISYFGVIHKNDLIFVGMLFYGISTATFIPVLTTIILNSATIEYKGFASAMLNTVRQVSTFIGIEFFSGIILTSSGQLGCRVYLM